jgi:DNA polymerase
MLEEMGLGPQWRARPGAIPGRDGPVAALGDASAGAAVEAPPASACSPEGPTRHGRAEPADMAPGAPVSPPVASGTGMGGAAAVDAAAPASPAVVSRAAPPLSTGPAEPPPESAARATHPEDEDIDMAGAGNSTRSTRTGRGSGGPEQESRAGAAAPAPEDPRTAAILGLDWDPLAAEVAGCTACSLARTRRCTVFGTGDRQAKWMFVGEGPGAEEDATGLPFVGQAGRLLDSMLAALGLARDRDVYIANIVKCRPPGNRVPTPAEVAACEPFLHRQIALVRPALIIALGKTAAVTLLGREQSIASMRGQVYRYQDTPLVVTYHPAYLLRNLPEKAKSWEDLCFARALVRGAGTGEAAGPPAEAGG